MLKFSEYINESTLANTVQYANNPIQTPRGYPMVIGWFRNKQNPGGWSIIPLDGADEAFLKLQGYKADKIQQIKRVVSDKGNTALVQFNINTGTYAFADNEHLENTDKLIFDKMTKFSALLIDNTELARKSFNL